MHQNITFIVSLLQQKCHENKVNCLLYIASGNPKDWAFGVAGIPYSIGMELRPGQFGPHGFVLPPDQIIPTGEETWAFHQTAARMIIDEFGNNIPL